MVELANFSLKLGSKELFQDANFVFNSDQTYVIYGENGSGKSTLFYLLSGMSYPYHGSLKINQIERKTLTASQISQAVSLCTSNQQVGDISVAEIFDFSNISIHNHPDIIKFFDLNTMLHRRVQTMSDGEKQWLFIARAFLAHKPIILLDEPTSFLDRKKRSQLVEFIEYYQSNTPTLIMINSHDMDFMEIPSIKQVNLEGRGYV